MLACARIGAIHSVVFGGYSVDALATRSRTRARKSSSPRMVVTGAANRWRSNPRR